MQLSQFSKKFVTSFNGIDEAEFTENARRFSALDRWQFSMITTKEQTPWTFWCIPFFSANAPKKNDEWADYTPDFILRLTETAMKHMCQAFPEQRLALNRCLLNGKTYGQDGSIHQDNSQRARQEYTLLYYPLATWAPEWEGETVFYSNDKRNIEVSIPYTPNTFLLWDARVWHCGRAPARICPELRITMVWNFVCLD